MRATLPQVLVTALALFLTLSSALSSTEIVDRVNGLTSSFEALKTEANQVPIPPIISIGSLLGLAAPTVAVINSKISIHKANQLTQVMKDTITDYEKIARLVDDLKEDLNKATQPSFNGTAERSNMRDAFEAVRFQAQVLIPFPRILTSVKCNKAHIGAANIIIAKYPSYQYFSDLQSSMLAALVDLHGEMDVRLPTFVD